MDQRAKPTAEEVPLVEEILLDFRGDLKPLVLKHLKRFPVDLRIYGLVILGHIAFDGVDFKPEDLKE